MKIVLRTIDLETTGMEADDEVIEAALTDVEFDTETKESVISGTTAILFRAEKGISAEASGAHHIIDADVADCPVCTPETLMALASQGDPYALVAHNRAFELQWIKPEVVGPKRWIDTLKCARRLLPDAPNHKNGTLPYVMGLSFDRARAQPPHRAGPDTYVTAIILAEFLKRAPVAQLVEWTKAPLHFPTCPLTKHKGQPWEKVPGDYLRWIIDKSDCDGDLKANAQMEVDRRRTAQQQKASS